MVDIKLHNKLKMSTMFRQLKQRVNSGVPKRSDIFLPLALTCDVSPVPNP